jgi:hypothetical protein
MKTMITMRLAARVLCAACLIAGSACRPAPSEEARAAQMRAALLARLLPPQQQLFTTLEPSGYRPSLIGVVVADVFAFREALGPGAALRGDPLDHLANQGSPLAAQWLRAPVVKRVFAAGAGADGPPVEMFAEMLRAGGYEVFYYDYCQNRQPGLGECPTETVGVYFATAGHLLVGTSEATVRSGLVREESTGAPPLPANARRAVLITPAQAVTIGETGATDFAAVEIATRPPIPDGGG